MSGSDPSSQHPALAFLGTGAFGAPALRAVCAAGFHVVRVVSQPDRPAGRGRAVRPTPLHALAEQLGLPHVQTEDVNALDPRVVLGEAALGVVIDFGQKIGPALLSAAGLGFLNLHGSLLPKYRGAAPVQWAILNGDAATGVTVFQINEQWDAGAVLLQAEVTIEETETADELHDRLAELGGGLLPGVIQRFIAGEIRPTPQPAGEATRAPKLSRALSPVDWSRPAREIVRQIHGLWSWPAAECCWIGRSGRTERLRLKRARCEEVESRPGPAAAPGEFLPDLSVQTGRGRLRLLEVQPAGGKVMAFESFANGRAVAPPDRLGPVEVT